MERQETGALAIKQTMALLLRWAWLMATCAAVAAAAAYLVSRRAAPVYEATAVLLISEGQK
ncbi:MAG: hypothetical protein QME94_19925, partial [Anaerolineae bacterium]|nr:hypothetical protein [Anaerolineae bacterium]